MRVDCLESIIGATYSYFEDHVVNYLQVLQQLLFWFTPSLYRGPSIL